MSAPHSSSCLTVTDPEQARLMVHPDFGPVVDALTGRESTIAALAGQLGHPLDATHYRVKKLLRSGLLRVVGEEKRAGRAVKRYSAVADSFFIPYSSLTHATLEDKFMAWETRFSALLVRSQLRLLRDTFPDLGRVGPLVYRDGQGRLTEDLALSPTQPLDPLDREFPAFVNDTLRLRLPFAQAKALQAELDAVVRRFLAAPASDQGEQLYALRLTLTPVNEADLP